MRKTMNGGTLRLAKIKTIFLIKIVRIIFNSNGFPVKQGILEGIKGKDPHFIR